MSHTPHELAAELPDLAPAISARKLSDPHFARLTEDYHTLNREIHRAETNVEPTEQLHEGELRKQRMALKDEIAQLISAAQTA